MGQSRNDKIATSRKLQLQDRVRGFKRFLDEGKMYLNMAGSMHECNERSSATFAIMLRTLDTYTRLKVQLREDMLQMYRYLHNIEDEDAPIGNPDDDEAEDEDEGDTEDDDDDDDNSDELEDTDSDNEFAFDNYEDYIDWHGEISYRKLMMANIELLIARIQEMYASLIESRLSLCLMLADYCDRARLFLRRNARYRRSGGTRRGRSLIHGIRYKYGLLERLLARIGEEQEYIAKYVDMTRNNASGRSND